MSTDVYLEIGSKKVFACAVEWPGWCRSGRTEDAALDALATYAARYRPVTERAGVRLPKSAGDDLRVVQRVAGSATTDFGAPDSRSVEADQRPLTKAAAARLAALLEASWAVWDDAVAAAPASLRKGPRGGGRDRDKMVDHVVDAEVNYVRMIGLKIRQPELGDAAAVAAERAAILDVLRAARAPLPDRERGWPYRYAARRIAWHVLDHAWEMEDRSTP